MGSWPPWWPDSRGQSRPGPTSHELPDPGGEDVVPGEGVDGGLASPGAPGLLPRLGEEAPDHLQEDAQDDGVERQVQVPVHPRLLFLAVEVDPLEFGVEEPRLLESFVLRNHDPRLPSAGPVRVSGASQRGGGLRGSAPLFLYRDAGGRRGRGGLSAGEASGIAQRPLAGQVSRCLVGGSQEVEEGLAEAPGGRIPELAEDRGVGGGGEDLHGKARGDAAGLTPAPGPRSTAAPTGWSPPA